MTDVKVKEPFVSDLHLDMRREDHKDHNLSRMNSREKEDRKILQHLEKVNWVKNKSALDLSELIRNHKNRQPQLLAMLHPDIKSSLLYNPVLTKTLDQL